MDVILDSNVFIRDLWLESQATRVLLNYLRRMHSYLLLPDAVYAEILGKARREFSETASRVDAGIKQANRRKLRRVPAYEFDASLTSTMTEWEANFHNVLSTDVLRRVPLDTTVLPEAIRRAAERLPPCKPSGAGIRDTIIWLNIISYASSLEMPRELAFVSGNTSDFAGADNRCFRQELQVDLSAITSPIHFFPGLAEFNKEHADPIKHVTPEWVIKKGALRAVNGQLNAWFEYMELSPYFRVGNSEYSDYYEPTAIETIVDIDIEIVDVSVWKFREAHIELAIEFEADVTAEALCILTNRPSRFWSRSYDDDLDDEYSSEKSLTSYAQIGGTISAVADGEAVTFSKVENLHNR